MAGSTGVATQVSVLVPGLLRSYTSGAEQVELIIAAPAGAAAPCVGDALAALEARFPGLRFRIVDEQGRVRPHIKLFVDRTLVRELSAPLPATTTLMIVGALSGG